ncbi:MAG: TIM barrel protein [Gemmiger sp.]
MNDRPRFGPAGLSDSYTVKKFDPAAIAAHTAAFGLTAFEYQCGRGVRLAQDKARALGAACAEQDIVLSVHAPYYISMSSLEEDKRLHSIDYLLQSCALVKALGGRRVIFHAGSCGKQSREAALEKAMDTMRRAQAACDEAGFADCVLCPETMGKVNQLGDLEEVLALCSVDRRITPCIDFGHLYARTQGGITGEADYAAILDRLAAALGDERAANFHAHFSRIAYTKGGEKCHLTFADTEFGPPHAPLIGLLKRRGLTPTIICESAGTQAEDAGTLARCFAAPG